MQFLSTIFAIHLWVGLGLVLFAIAYLFFGRVPDGTWLAGPKGPEAFGIRPTGQNPSRKSIHDRADEGSDADCYLIAVLSGGMRLPGNKAGGRPCGAREPGTDTHFRTSPRTGQRGL